MTKPKLPPAIEARLQEAREARADDAAARREAGSGRAPRRPQDIAAARRKLKKRRGQMRRHAERGELRRWGIVPLAEAFADEELRDLLLTDAAGQAAKGARHERLREREEVASLASQIEREREQEARREAEAEARERLGVEG